MSGEGGLYGSHLPLHEANPLMLNGSWGQLVIVAALCGGACKPEHPVKDSG